MAKIGITICTAKAVSKFKGEKLTLPDDVDDVEEEDYEVSIARSDLRGVLFNIGGRLTKKEIDALVLSQNLDEDTSQISRVEFLRVIMFASLVICIFDRQGHGSISVRDLAKAMENFTNSYSEEEILNLVKSVQTNKNGTIDYEHFVELINTTR